MLEKVEINSKMPAKGCIIWLHGLGADGYDFVDIIAQLALPDELALRFIFPHAPLRRITFSHNAMLRAWFDLAELDTAGANKDEKGIYASQNLVAEVIDAEIANGIASKNIVLAGFSQGGAMALQCGLRYSKPLAGILVLSGFLLLPDKLPIEKSIANLNTPILMLHGTLDHVVRNDWARRSYDKLLACGWKAKWKNYPMYHEVCPEEIQDISKWLREIYNRLDRLD